jgi:peptide/nickel transport system ATP-binding protein
VEPILEVQNLRKEFHKGKQTISAVDNVSFFVNRGENVALVGESGCGKSTIANLLTRLLPVTDGKILLNGKDITHSKGGATRSAYRDLQMVFQMPTDSFNPRRTLGASIAEPMVNAGMTRSAAKARTLELLKMVGLKTAYAERYPHQVSGGECQRAAIARAISIEPDLLICDEATSALDVSVQAQIVALLRELQEKMGMAYLFICHDMALVQNICDRVLVMHRGQIVESGTVAEVIGDPKHPYTQLLLSSVFPVEPDPDWQVPKLPQETESSTGGCTFRTRCGHCTDHCGKESPVLHRIGETGTHEAACFLFPDEK